MHKIRPAIQNDVVILASKLAKDYEYSSWKRNDLLEYVEKQNHTFLCVGENIDGFIIYSAVLDEAEIIMIWVNPDTRNKGMASKLLIELFNQARSKDIHRIFLEVAADNKKAISLYTANGFVQIGKRNGYYTRANGETIDALAMQYGS